ncbi:MAG: glycosyltransferase [Ruminococcus sp.]|nr:glycosyltransferase [Ruminococcus sp.]
MSGKLRVLEVNKAYYPHIGGIETIIRQYAEELGKTGGFDVKVLVCRDDRGGMRREKINGVDVTRCGSLGTYFSCPISMQFIRKFREMAEKADVVHIHVPFPLADAALMLSGYKGKVVVSWHSDIVKQKKLMLLYKPLMYKLLRRADRILVATEGHIIGSDYLPEFWDKCVVVPYGIVPEDYRRVKPGNFLEDKCTYHNSVKVLFSGRLVYYKGVDVLIEAFRGVSGCELFISGAGELESELKARVRNTDIEERVHFLGFLSQKELRMAFADCDIFVLPSVERSEAFGIVQLEAMVYGKPVINTSLPSGVPYVSIHGDTGMTVPPSDTYALAFAINRLADDRELREEMGRAAAERVDRVFNEKIVIEKLCGVLSGSL